ncbi:MAG: hypothetical protein E7349_00585 [Clostridiales bacterium]|nr:hypothetical protein [Clostridiales bacterium]
MYAMNDKNRQKNAKEKRKGSVAKECAYLAVFVALTIAVQLIFAAVPGVELVTVLFVSYAFVFGWKRGLTAATVFSLLRQIVFGFYPIVLILYLVYFNLLAAGFGILGVKIKKIVRALPVIVLLACLGTAFFHLFDNLLTPIWYGYSQRATWVYFQASLSFMIPQIISTAISVSILFLPLCSVFTFVRRGLK